MPPELTQDEQIQWAFNRQQLIDRYFRERGLTRNTGHTRFSGRAEIANCIEDQSKVEQYGDTIKAISSDVCAIDENGNLSDQSKSEALLAKARSTLHVTENLNGNMASNYPTNHRFFGNVIQDIVRGVGEAEAGNTDGV